MTKYFKPGDWLTLFIGAMAVVFLFVTLWQGGKAERVLIRSGGKIFAEESLQRDQTIAVPGPLGISRVAILGGQARIESDPSPRQYCVKQGWLKNAGEAALCLPNQVSVELLGTHRNSKRYDSISY